MHALDIMRTLASKAEVIHLNQGDVLFRTGETGTCTVSYTHLRAHET